MAQGKGNPEINKKVATSALVTTLLSGVGFYLGNRYWEAVASFGGQFFEHWGDGFAAMWPPSPRTRRTSTCHPTPCWRA